MIKNIKQKTNQLLLFLILIYPIGGSLVLDPPFSSRSIIGAPIAAILMGLGMITLFTMLQKIRKGILTKAIACLVGACLTLNIFTFMSFYFFHYPSLSADYWGWQYGAKDIVSYFVSQEENYDELIMEPAFNGPDIFFKFYAPTACQNCRTGVIHNAYDPLKKQLFATTPSYLYQQAITNFITKKKILYPDGTVAFHIGEIVQ
jgi:hypothetical protein